MIPPIPNPVIVASNSGATRANGCSGIETAASPPMASDALWGILLNLADVFGRRADAELCIVSPELVPRAPIPAGNLRDFDY